MNKTLYLSAAATVPPGHIWHITHVHVANSASDNVLSLIMPGCSNVGILCGEKYFDGTAIAFGRIDSDIIIDLPAGSVLTPASGTTIVYNDLVVK